MAKSKQQQIKELRDEALALVRSEDHKKALDRFNQLERLDPTEADWPRRAADCHRARSDVPAQIAALGRAAELYAKAGALPKAMALCKMILALDPRHTATQARLAALQGSAAPAHGSLLAPSPLRPPLPAAPARPLPAAPKQTEAPTAAVKQTEAPVAPRTEIPGTDAPPALRGGRPELSQALRQRRAAQGKGPPTTAPGAPTTAAAPPAPTQVAIAPPFNPPPPPARAAAPPAPPKRSAERPPKPAASPAVPPASLPAPERRPTPPAVPILEDASLNEAVPGSMRIPGPRGVPSGMFRIELGDLRTPKTSESPQEKAQKTLPTTPLFSELGPASLERLIARARLVHLEPGSVAYRRGDPADSLYVIASGAVVLVAEGEARVETAKLADGEFFGEAALLGSEPRPTTAEVREPTDLLAIDSQVIRELIVDEPGLLTTVLRFLRNRLVESSLLTNPIFTILSRAERQRLAEHFDFVEIEPGSLAIWQGVRSPGLFILLSGTAEVVMDDEGEDRRLAVLGAGAVFGEMSLLRSEAAIADVRCVTSSYALMLPKADFAAVVAEFPAVLEFVELLAATRHRQNELLLGARA
jgi:CRP-like cAMP-binding protein